MASTFSTSLKLELQATGENAGTWGTKTNTNLELVDSIIIEKSEDIEVDNLIDIGGSNAYAYLLKVS